MTPRSTASLSLLAAALLALGLLSTALVTLREPLGPGDYVQIWGLKARALFRSGSFDSLVRVDPQSASSHVEYPPLWPILLASSASPAGRYDDLLVAPVWLLLALLAALLTLRSTEAERPFTILAAAAVSLLPYWRRYPGYAEGLLVVFLIAAVGEFERLDRDRFATVRLAVFLTLAAWTKTEGLLAALVAAAGLLVAKRVRTGLLVGLSSVLLAALPWRMFVALRAPAPPPTDFSWAAFSIPKLALALSALASESAASLGWLAGAAFLLALAPGTRARRAGLLACLAAYSVALAGSFAFTRLDPAWHVRWSWDRLVFIPTALLLPVLAEALWECVGGETGSAPAPESPAAYRPQPPVPAP